MTCASVAAQVDATSSDVADLLSDAQSRVKDDPTALAEPQTFDLAYSAIRAFAVGLPADAQHAACDLMATALQQTTRTSSAARRH